MTRPIVFVAQRPVDALAGHGDYRPALVVACEGGPEARAVAARLQCPVETLEHRAGTRCVWTNATVAAAASLLDEVEVPPRSVLLPYASSATLTQRAKHLRLDLLGVDDRLKDALDDKAATRKALRMIGVRVPESMVVASTSSLVFEAIAARFGRPFVVQRLRGSAGLGTWIVRTRHDLDVVDALGADPVLVSRYVGELVLNVHGDVTAAGAAAGPPSVQAAGVPELSGCGVGYGGNDFGLAAGVAGEQVLAQLDSTTVRVGEWLRSRGYRGIFGVDYALGCGGPYALEVNPRLQGSTWLLGELERDVGRMPIGAAHAASWSTCPTTDRYEASPLRGALLVAHHLGREPAYASEGLAPGVYQLAGDAITFRRPGLSPADCRSEDEIVVGGVPHAGVRIDPGAVVARISARAGLLEGSAELSRRGRHAVAAVRGRLFGVTHA